MGSLELEVNHFDASQRVSHAPMSEAAPNGRGLPPTSVVGESPAKACQSRDCQPTNENLQ